MMMTPESVSLTQPLEEDLCFLVCVYKYIPAF